MSLNYPIAPLEAPRRVTPHTEIMIITPDVARTWLLCNYRNRRIKPVALEALMKDLDGNYDLNGESIKFSRPVRTGEVDGMKRGDVLLIDGQHRLTAISHKEPDFAIPMFVASGLDPETRRTVDSGKPRSMSDVLKLEGYGYTTTTTAIAKRVYQREHGDIQFTGEVTPTKPELFAFIENNDALLRAVEVASRVRFGGNRIAGYRFASQGVVGTASYYFTRLAPTVAPEFFARLQDGANMDYDHPIMALRRRLEKDSNDKKRNSFAQQFAYYARAWNAVREDRTLANVVHKEGNPIPDLV